MTTPCLPASVPATSPQIIAARTSEMLVGSGTVLKK
jgi:hypothetical protein